MGKEGVLMEEKPALQKALMAEEAVVDSLPVVASYVTPEDGGSGDLQQQSLARA